MIRVTLSVIAAALITSALLWHVLTPDIIQALRVAAGRADWLALGGALALSGFVQWLRACRFAIMMKGTPCLPDAGLVQIAFRLNMLNFLLPFRLGEISFPLMMRKTYGYSLLHSTGVLLLARVFDLCAIGSILLLSAAALDIQMPLSPAILSGAGALLAIGPIALVTLLHPIRRLLLKVKGVAAIVDKLSAGLDSLTALPARTATVLLGYVIWLTFGGLAILVAKAVVDTVPPVTAMFGAAAGNVAFALPINGLAGLGPAQAAWVAGVTRAAVPWEDAVISALALHAVVLGSAVLFGLIASMGYRRLARQPAVSRP